MKIWLKFYRLLSSCLFVQYPAIPLFNNPLFSCTIFCQSPVQHSAIPLSYIMQTSWPMLIFSCNSILFPILYKHHDQYWYSSVTVFCHTSVLYYANIMTNIIIILYSILPSLCPILCKHHDQYYYSPVQHSAIPLSYIVQTSWPILSFCCNSILPSLCSILCKHHDQYWYPPVQYSAAYAWPIVKILGLIKLWSIYLFSYIHTPVEILPFQEPSRTNCLLPLYRRTIS